ncbi:AraC family transcriptional regulator, regulatory protein of adaptative response / methylated-DNA-[protein]-cysteine methyltransferase [Palleronia marisminoris]|uniref:methylated-DNA--[protein]-cysteine S-methyltransferase n=2 Tax=Palleronia marisminoris TaxID=315423 RepID=A0A1Y5RVQ2_9RHOB|nr:AraC family transcriptional regulator, regulatory protein of adaptative response / methylated-DNA-[protein]-cysteine methyltransferase [Palleronia marisminoris]SLN26549.1 Bifunctional transcriptional activator/DNA repair enzyme Ada [Palleronia marisminoris]
MTQMQNIETHYHWQLMRRAIERLDTGREMTLEEIAAEMTLSPAHFQRLFSRWAGISPKRFQQFLTLGHAKRLLAERHTLIDTSGELGLSGTSRLHDLFLRWEAMSPGTYARKGEGLTIAYASANCPFGRMLAMATPQGLAGLAFTEESGDEAAFADLCGRWPAATYVEDDAALAPHFTAISQGGESRLHLMGGPFQIKVWEALLAIPEGRVTTYSEIARAIGHPKAHRAVGTAVGRNPISWLIPCHRALRQSGELGGYHWGLPVKRALLADEAARTGF